MAFSLGHVWGKWFQQNTEGVLGIDIGSSAIKVVQLKEDKGKPVLITYGELALGPYGGVEVGRSVQLPTDRLIEALRDVLREAQVTTKVCAISIPLASSLMSFIELPDVGKKQLASMIPIEARKYIPVPISEVTLDWLVIPRKKRASTERQGMFGKAAGKIPPRGTASPQELWGLRKTVLPAEIPKTDVLLVAIHNEALERYNTIVGALGLEVGFIEIEIFSTVRSVVGSEQAPVLVIDMGASATKLYMIEQGLVRSSHIINRGSQDITLALARAMNIAPAQAEEVKRGVGLGDGTGGSNVAAQVPLQLEYIFGESNRVLARYQQKHNKTVQKVVVTGGGVLMPGFLAAAHEQFSVDVVWGDPFAKVQAPGVLEDMLKQAGPEFAVSVGVALRQLDEMG